MYILCATSKVSILHPIPYSKYCKDQWLVFRSFCFFSRKYAIFGVSLHNSPQTNQTTLVWNPNQKKHHGETTGHDPKISKKRSNSSKSQRLCLFLRACNCCCLVVRHKLGWGICEVFQVQHVELETICSEKSVVVVASFGTTTGHRRTS